MAHQRINLAILCIHAAPFLVSCSSDDAAAPEQPGGANADAYLLAGGIGVSDLERSFAFYRDVLGMALRYDLEVPGYANEKVLHFPESKASDVVLMNYIDGKEHNYTRNPVKLVFYVPSAATVVDRVRAQGLDILLEPSPQEAFGGVTVGFARDPDGYVLEFVEDATLTVPYLGATGIGVSDLSRSTDFYTRVLHMEKASEVIQVPSVWDEIILRYPSGKGSSVVLLHYTDGSTRNYTNVPVKLVHRVPDAGASVGAVAGEGLEVVLEPLPFTANGTEALVALAKDPDGYTLEMVTPK
jgi:lactoylglutathione lyase